MDKVSFIQHLWVLGTQFTVDPNAFIVHLPHPTSIAIDSGVSWLPAKLDKAAYWIGLESIFIGEKYEEVALQKMLRHGGRSIESAALEAKRLGDEYASRERMLLLGAAVNVKDTHQVE